MTREPWVSVVVPVLTEAASLRRVVGRVLEEEAVREVVVVTGKRTTSVVREAIASLERISNARVRSVEQVHDGLGGALRRGIEAACGTHVITMYSDLESDPETVPALIAAAEANPRAVINASRWLPGGGFEQYDRVKLLMNRVFQSTFSHLFASTVTDFTFGYRVYPREVLQRFDLVENGHRFVLEAMLRPLIGGVTVVEVPSRWRRRTEGSSPVTLATYLPYWSLGLRLWAQRLRQ